MEAQLKFPVRAQVAVQIFLAMAVQQLLRTCFNVAIHSMVVEHPMRRLNLSNCPNDPDEIQDIIRDFGPRFEWSIEEQKLLASAYLWGSVLTPMLGGRLAERYGAHQVIFVSTIAGATLTVFFPFAAHIGYYVALIVRFVLGLFGGVYGPCATTLIVHWSPRTERGKFNTILFGSTIGIFLSWLLLYFFISNFGWAYAYFVTGIATLLWCIPWWVIVRNSPQSHPKISDDELRLIIERLPKHLKRRTKYFPPYIQIFTNMKIWALIVLHFGDRWGLHVSRNLMPRFIAEGLGVSIMTAIKMGGVPCISRVVCALFFGGLGDYIRRNRLLTVTSTRKGFVVFSHFLPCLCLFAINFSGCSRSAALTLLSWSLAFASASTMTNLQNAQDLAPNYAGTVYGTMNFIANGGSMVLPLCTDFFLAKHSTLYEWHAIYSLCALVYLLTGVFYILFGTAHRQRFNERSFSRPSIYT